MILVIGDTSNHLANWTIDKFGKGQLANNSNYNAINGDVYFSGLGDLTFDQLKTLALLANEVYFVTELPWIDQAALVKTTVLCNHVSQFRKINGFVKTTPELFLTVPVSRQHKEPTLWTFGCSHTDGTGLTYPETEVYGKVLADSLNMPWQNVAKAGSSTKWSLAHLMQAELRPNDIVIWATTSAERIRIASNGIKEVQLAVANKSAVQYYTDEQIIFEHLDSVNAGVKYLRATNTKFILLTLLSQSVCFNQIELGCSCYKEWCPSSDWMEHDRGNDGIHMGPIGHTKLAKRIHNHIQLLEYDKSI